MNWQLSTVSQLAAGCQFDFYQALNWQLSTMPIRKSYHKRYNELATVNWQLAANSISIKNVELATVNCQPAAYSMNLYI